MLELIRRLLGTKAKFQTPPQGYLNPHSTLGELDLYLITEGRHEKLWSALGAHVRRDANGAFIGTAFSV
ncbi:MAG: hypothetical protein ACKO8Y_00220, partial [Actinomycetota bacterium]